MLNQAHKGRRGEHRARKILETAGFMVTRAAGSKGPADLIAWNAVQIRFISVKSGGKYASAIEREALKEMAAPPNATKEIWRLPDRCHEPLIEVL
jgi:Holliday junction resolvase